jgi:hypothetical protein
MAQRQGQVVFAKGEVSPQIEARMDVAAYGSGVRSALNVYVRKYGGLSKRLGTRFVAEVHDATEPVRLIPFQFSIEQAYALELGQGYMRAAASGGMVLEDRLTIEGITFGSTTAVHASYHAYAVGDQVFFADTGVPELDGRFGIVLSVADANNFTVDIDSTGFTAFVADTGGTIRVGAPPPPPPPPPVPPPAPTPTPPDTGGGGFGGGGGGIVCATADSLYLMANEAKDGPGVEKAGNLLFAGDHLWTQHNVTGEWGAFPIERVSFVMDDVFKADDLPQALPDVPVRPLRATGSHPFGGKPWRYMRDIGTPDGRDKVVVLKVKDAHTYVVNGVLSHNKTQYPDL